MQHLLQGSDEPRCQLAAERRQEYKPVQRGVEAKGEQLQVYFDDRKVIEANDSTFADAGKVGLWTKADSIIQFDDFTVRAP